MFSYFFSSKLKQSYKILSDGDIYNVDKFNEWFNTIYSGYSGTSGSPGIFLRVDKLSPSMIIEWFDYLEIDKNKYDEYTFYTDIKADWFKKLNK